MQQWEYLEVVLRFDKKSWQDNVGRSGKLKKGATAELLNELGRDGWEWAGAFPLDGTGGRARVVFKRAAPDDTSPPHDDD